MFGFLVVRHIEDKAKALAHCIRRNRDSTNQKEVIMVLEDRDIMKLIKARLQYPNGINKLLFKKLDKILF